MPTTAYFLLTYRPSDQSLDVADLGTDAVAADENYTTTEAEHRHEPDVQVVLIGADSIETIRRTHAHYFDADLGREFFDSVVPVGSVE